MTKRTKLLSLVVAAALCLVAGFAMMFSSTANADTLLVPVKNPGTNADFVLSTAKDWVDEGSGMAGLAHESGLTRKAGDSGQYTANWIIYNYNIPANVSRTGTSLSYKIGTTWTGSDIATGSISDEAILDALFVNATEDPVNVKIAIDTLNGVISYSRAGAEWATMYTFTEEEKTASNAASSAYSLFTVPELSNYSRLAFEVYDEDFFNLNARLGNAGNMNIPSTNYFVTNDITDVIPTVDNSAKEYTKSGGEAGLVNAEPASDNANWIIYEWTNGKNNNLGAINANAFHIYVGTDSQYAHSISTSTACGFAATADAKIKLLYNLNDGTCYVSENNVISPVNAYSSRTGAVNIMRHNKNLTSKASYAGFCFHNSSITELYDLKCYDDTGKDLGITGSKVFEEATISANLDKYETVDWDFAGRNYKFPMFATNSGVTGAEWVVFDYKLPAEYDPETTADKTSITLTFAVRCDYASAIGAVSAEAGKECASVDVTLPKTHPLVANATDSEVRVRFAVNLTNGIVYGKVADGDYIGLTQIADYSNVQGLAKKYVYFAKGGVPSVSTISDVKVYTENSKVDFVGGNAGNVHQAGWYPVANKAVKSTPLATVEAPEGLGAFYSFKNDGAWISNQNATDAEWIIFEWTNGPDNFMDAKPGHMFGYGLANPRTPAQTVCAADRQTLVNTVSTVTKVAFSTKSGEVFYKISDGEWTLSTGYTYYAGASEEMFASILWNNGVRLIELNGVKCYDEEGNDLGVESNYLPISREILTLNGVSCNTSLNRYNVTGTAVDQYDNPVIPDVEIPAGSIIKVNGEDFETKAGLAGYQVSGSFTILFNSAALGYAKIGDVPAMEITIPANTMARYINQPTVKFNHIIINDVTFYVNGSTCGLSVPDVELRPANDFNTLTSNTLTNENNAVRYQGSIGLVNAESNAVDAFNWGNLTALKNGTEAATINVSNAGDLRLIYIGQFVETKNDQDFNLIEPTWYLIEAGTMLGVSGRLAEDYIFFIGAKENKAHLFKADLDFAITYAGADAGSNPASYSFGDDVALEDGADITGKVFAGWYLDGQKIENVSDIIALGYAADVTLTAKYVTEVTLKDYVAFVAQTGLNRYIVGAEEIVFFDGTNDIPATFDFGTIAALDMEGDPIDIVFIKAADANGTYQLIQSTVFGQAAIADIATAAYLIQAGTVIGEYILTEDVVLIVDGDKGAALMPADYEFAISYENVREATNGNATSYAIDDTIELANIEKDGMTFLGWYVGETQVTEIAFPAFYGDVTLTAKWAQADFVKMNGEIMPNGMLVVNFYAVVENLENVSVTFNGQAGMPGVLDADKSEEAGLPVYKFSTYVLGWEIDENLAVVILSGADEVANIAGAPVDYLEGFLDSQDAELKALVANFIAYAADMDTQMNGSTEIDVPQAATLATIPEVGYGELGMRDDANKFDAPAIVSGNPVLVFNTDKTGDLIVKINGEEFDTYTVADGKISINVGELTGANVIGAKLAIEVYQGTTKLGNTAVINVAAVMGDLYEEAPATVNMVARLLALYNALVAYNAD